MTNSWTLSGTQSGCRIARAMFARRVHGLFLLGLSAACTTEVQPKTMVESRDCAICHLDNYDETRSPPHAEAQFPEEACASCHNESAWKPAFFEHTETFPLELGHAEPDCATCHAEQGYAPKAVA